MSWRPLWCFVGLFGQSRSAIVVPVHSPCSCSLVVVKAAVRQMIPEDDRVSAIRPPMHMPAGKIDLGKFMNFTNPMPYQRVSNVHSAYGPISTACEQEHCSDQKSKRSHISNETCLFGENLAASGPAVTEPETLRWLKAERGERTMREGLAVRTPRCAALVSFSLPRMSRIESDSTDVAALTKRDPRHPSASG